MNLGHTNLGKSNLGKPPVVGSFPTSLPLSANLGYGNLGEFTLGRPSASSVTEPTSVEGTASAILGPIVATVDGHVANPSISHEGQIGIDLATDVGFVLNQWTATGLVSPTDSTLYSLGALIPVKTGTSGNTVVLRRPGTELIGSSIFPGEVDAPLGNRLYRGVKVTVPFKITILDQIYVNWEAGAVGETLLSEGYTGAVYPPHVWKSTSFDLTLNLTDGKIHRVGFYCMDSPRDGRIQRIDAYDGDTGTALDTSSTNRDIAEGVWWIFDISGKVRFRFTNSASYDAVVEMVAVKVAGATQSGNTAARVTEDITSQGDWVTAMGGTRSNVDWFKVVNQEESEPLEYLTLTTSGASLYTSWSNPGDTTRQLGKYYIDRFRWVGDGLLVGDYLQATATIDRAVNTVEGSMTIDGVTACGWVGRLFGGGKLDIGIGTGVAVRGSLGNFGSIEVGTNTSLDFLGTRVFLGSWTGDGILEMAIDSRSNIVASWDASLNTDLQIQPLRVLSSTMDPILGYTDVAFEKTPVYWGGGINWTGASSVSIRAGQTYVSDSGMRADGLSSLEWLGKVQRWGILSWTTGTGVGFNPAIQYTGDLNWTVGTGVGIVKGNLSAVARVDITTFSEGVIGTVNVYWGSNHFTFDGRSDFGLTKVYQYYAFAMTLDGGSSMAVVNTNMYHGSNRLQINCYGDLSIRAAQVYVSTNLFAMTGMTLMLVDPVNLYSAGHFWASGLTDFEVTRSAVQFNGSDVQVQMDTGTDLRIRSSSATVSVEAYITGKSHLEARASQVQGRRWKGDPPPFTYPATTTGRLATLLKPWETELQVEDQVQGDFVSLAVPFKILVRNEVMEVTAVAAVSAAEEAAQMELERVEKLKLHQRDLDFVPTKSEMKLMLSMKIWNGIYPEDWDYTKGRDQLDGIG